jgi:hypothetical protein
MLIYQHLTEVTNECSDTEPVMFILQENRLYLELETIGPLVHIQIFGTFLTLSLKLMPWYVTSVSRVSLYVNFGSKCVKILKFWRTELSYAQNKNRGKKMHLLGLDTCPRLNDIMEIRCNKCTRSEQVYDF